jgi:hypothetical protein
MSVAIRELLYFYESFGIATQLTGSVKIKTKPVWRYRCRRKATEKRISIAMKQQIEEALQSGDAVKARELLSEWGSQLAEKYGFSIPSELQEQMWELRPRIDTELNEQRMAKELAERRAGWMVPETNWSSEPGSRMRQARLLIRNPAGTGGLEWFQGKDIDGVRILASKRVKAGKWSHDEYRLRLQQGFAAIPMKVRFDSGTVLGGLGKAVGLSEMATTSEVADVLEVPVEEVEKLVTV